MKPSIRQAQIRDLRQEIEAKEEQLRKLENGCTHVDDNYEWAYPDDGGAFDLPMCTICGKKAL